MRAVALGADVPTFLATFACFGQRAAVWLVEVPAVLVAVGPGAGQAVEVVIRTSSLTSPPWASSFALAFAFGWWWCVGALLLLGTQLVLELLHAVLEFGHLGRVIARG